MHGAVTEGFKQTDEQVKDFSSLGIILFFVPTTSFRLFSASPYLTHPQQLILFVSLAHSKAQNLGIHYWNFLHITAIWHL